MGADNSITRGAEASAQSSLDPERIKATLALYGDLISAGDAQGIVALFAREAVIRDPITAPAREGVGAIAQFYREAVTHIPGLTMRLDGEVRVAGDYGAAAYIAEWIGEDGKKQRMLTLDVMHFNADGLITSMDAYWGPSGIGPAPAD